MSCTKPTSRFLCFSLTLLLLLAFFSSFTASDPIASDAGSADLDLDGIEELIALDEAEEEEEKAHVKSLEAGVLSKAQKIVLELNGDNSERVIDGNEFVLVLGYAPWCARSAELMPQFAEAATALKELGSSLLMAKLDGDRYSKAASHLGIKGFPSLLLFVNGSSQAYTGGFTSEEIVIWARKKTGVPVTRLSTIAEATEFVERHTMFVIGLFEKFEGPHYKEFVKAAITDNEIQFVEVSDTEVAKFLFPDTKLNNLFLGLVKNEPERYTAYEGAFEKDKILKFLDYNKFPLVNILTELNYVRVYGSPIKLQVLMFAEPDEFGKILAPLQDVARKFKNKIMFIYVDIRDENLAKPYLTLFGLEESEEAVVAAFDNKISSKYLLESDPTPRSIEEFCVGILQNTLLPYFKSQPVPDNKNASILTVVGKTFDELVLGSAKNIILEVHTPWCMNCEATSKQMEKLAKHFKDLDNLVFARIDASANEHPKLQVGDYPTLLFYPAGSKSKPIKLSPKSSLKELAAFINKSSRAQGQPPKDEL